MMKANKNRSSVWLVLGVLLGLVVLCVVFLKSHLLPLDTDQQSLREHLRIKSLNFFMPAQYKNLVVAVEQGQAIPTNYEVYYKVATQFMPSDFSGHYLLGLCYQSRGQWDEAVAEYQKSLRLYPGFFWTYYNIGILYWKTGQRDLAVSVWSAALKIPPQATFKAFFSQKLLNDCVIDLRPSGYDPGQHIQKGYEDLARWVERKSFPENFKAVLF